MEKEKGGGVTTLESVCIGSNLCVSIGAKKPYKKGGKHEVHKHMCNSNRSIAV